MSPVYVLFCYCKTLPSKAGSFRLVPYKCHNFFRQFVMVVSLKGQFLAHGTGRCQVTKLLTSNILPGLRENETPHSTCVHQIFFPATFSPTKQRMLPKATEA